MDIKLVHVTTFLVGLASASPQFVVADQQVPPNATEVVDNDIKTLLSNIETDLGNDQTKSATLAEMLVSVEALLPLASQQTQQLVKEFPEKLVQHAEDAKKAGDPNKSASYSVYASVVRDYIGPAQSAKVATPAPTPSQDKPSVQDTKPNAKVPQPVEENPATMLVDRGDALLKQGNVAGARMLYEKAVSLGVGIAALKLGDTYDSDFLAQQNLRGIKPDQIKAADWYQKAQSMGVMQAGQKIKKIEDHKLADVQPK